MVDDSEHANWQDSVTIENWRLLQLDIQVNCHSFPPLLTTHTTP